MATIEELEQKINSLQESQMKMEMELRRLRLMISPASTSIEAEIAARMEKVRQRKRGWKQRKKGGDSQTLGKGEG